jgi:hypothetical protein
VLPALCRDCMVSCVCACVLCKCSIVTSWSCDVFCRCHRQHFSTYFACGCMYARTHTHTHTTGCHKVYLMTYLIDGFCGSYLLCIFCCCCHRCDDRICLFVFIDANEMFSVLLNDLKCRQRLVMLELLLLVHAKDIECCCVVCVHLDCCIYNLADIIYVGVV